MTKPPLTIVILRIVSKFLSCTIANRNLNKIHSRQSDRGKETRLMALNEPINAGSRYRSANVSPPAKWPDAYIKDSNKPPSLYNNSWIHGNNKIILRSRRIQCVISVETARTRDTIKLFQQRTKSVGDRNRFNGAA